MSHRSFGRGQRWSWGTLLLGLVSMACVGADGSGRESDPEIPLWRPWNVLVVSFDALRADELGAYGQELELTPAMDRFASTAVVFDNAWSAAPVTPTAFASLWSGRPAWDVFLGWQFEGENELTRIFRDRGYLTMGFFNNSQLTPERGFDRGWDGYQWFNSVADEEVAEQVDRWLARQARSTLPFFGWVHHLRPHSPYRRNPEVEHLYDPNYDGPFVETSTASFDSEDPRDQAQLRALYRGEVRRADQLFDRVLQQVQDLGLAESTVVVLLADHGEEFREHGVYQHRHLYRPALQVPLMVRTPEGDTGRVEAAFGTQGLGEALRSLLEGRWQFFVDGLSQRSLSAVAMTDRHYRAAALRLDDEQLVVRCVPSRQGEFYRLREDPDQARDLSESESVGVRSSVRDLVGRLEGLAGGDPCRRIEGALRGEPAPPTDSLDARTVEGLRRLGYVD